ncbi:MAG: hypothetical protein WBZ48_07815 [Bacteroidota bacterium]
MRYTRLHRLIVGIILSAYLVTGALSAQVHLRQTLFFKLDKSFSVHNDQSIDLDERPYWTSHKHITSSEQFSSDHILSAAEPWISVIATEQSVEIPATHLPASVPLISSNTLRAPPRS